MNAQRYTPMAMLLHWLQAAIIIWLIWRGWSMMDMPKGPERTAAYSLHKSLGLLMLAMVAWRLIWRRRHAPPALQGTPGEVRLVHGVHHLLYLLLVLVPASAYLASSFSAYPLKFFGLAVPKAGWEDEGINAVFKEMHELTAYACAAVIALHLLGVLKHVLLKDGTLQRMLPAGMFGNGAGAADQDTSVKKSGE